jgi:hypothetical protein
MTIAAALFKNSILAYNRKYRPRYSFSLRAQTWLPSPEYSTVNTIGWQQT